jgi:hypothetical protein
VKDKGAIDAYLRRKKRQGIHIAATPLFIVVRTYEKSDAPERMAAKLLRCSVTDVKILRREWGIKKG